MTENNKMRALYSIDLQDSFADALASGLIDRHSSDMLALARNTIILPNLRSKRALVDAFVRLSGTGLLLPKMVAIGDLDLGEALGNLLDPIGAAPDTSKAIDPNSRLFLLTLFVSKTDRFNGDRAEAMRLARELARVRDQLLIEGVAIERLAETADEIEAELASHWQQALEIFQQVDRAFRQFLADQNLVEPAERRNMLLEYIARKWRDTPPDSPIIAAGIASNSPAIVKLLAQISKMPQGELVFDGLDLACPEDHWQAIGTHISTKSKGAGAASQDRSEHIAAAPSHPQFHLKWMFDQMGVNRHEVVRWPHGIAQHKEPKQQNMRSDLIRNMFLPSSLSEQWGDLPAAARKCEWVSLIEAANIDEEAQSIALLMRETLEHPAKRCHLITPNRILAERVSAHLKRWNIEADDSAGRQLSDSISGRLLLALAECLAENFAPIALLNLLKHPYTHYGERRGQWLQGVRSLDLNLRGPLALAGLAGLHRLIEQSGDKALQSWWQIAEPILVALDQIDPTPVTENRDKNDRYEIAAEQPLSSWLEKLSDLAGRFSDDRIWSGAEGRALARQVEQLLGSEDSQRLSVNSAEMRDILRQFLDNVSVRPPYGQHPRLAIYGLLEARMQSADLVICAGLNEGSWPNLPQADPWLAPKIRALLGLQRAEFRIGLSAHDLARAMNAGELVLSHSKREGGAPAIASRFLLRLQVVVGQNGLRQRGDIIAHARAIDQQLPPVRIEQPKPVLPPSMRQTGLSVTQFITLKANPYAFYANKIMGLRQLDGLADEADAAWFGTKIHDVFEQWHREDQGSEQQLLARLEQLFAHPALDPITVIFARKKFIPALQWVAQQSAQCQDEGREIIGIESWGELDLGGIIFSGKADRIDRDRDGNLIIIDYKSGAPPMTSAVTAGYELQLGLLGLIARDGWFEDRSGEKLTGEALGFEYWTLIKNDSKGSETGYGKIASPVKYGSNRSDIAADQFVDISAQFLSETIDQYLRGNALFTAMLQPEYIQYNDYEQLMRLEEWYGRLGDG